MKTKETKKAIKKDFNNILSIGYCDAQYLLYYKKPFAYSERVEGWACDYYRVDNICISTGYSPIGDKVPYKVLFKLEKNACDIVNNYSLDTDQKKEQINELLIELINNLNK